MSKAGRGTRPLVDKSKEKLNFGVGSLIAVAIRSCRQPFIVIAGAASIADQSKYLALTCFIQNTKATDVCKSSYQYLPLMMCCASN